MKRPVGVIILGGLWILTGLGGLCSPLKNPVIFGGTIYTGTSAVVLRVLPSMTGIYLGVGLLTPFRHVWYLFVLWAGIGVAGLSLNLLHVPRMWEFYLRLGSRARAIPRLVTFMIESHYLIIAVYTLTAIYVYLQKEYFWSTRDL